MSTGFTLEQCKQIANSPDHRFKEIVTNLDPAIPAKWDLHAIRIGWELALQYFFIEGKE